MNTILAIFFGVISLASADTSSSPNLFNIEVGSQIQIFVSDDKLIYDKQRRWERRTPVSFETCSLHVHTHFNIVKALEAGLVTYTVKSIPSLGDSARGDQTEQDLSMDLTTEDLELPNLGFFCHKVWRGEGDGLLANKVSELMETPRMFERTKFSEQSAVLARDFFPPLTTGKTLQSLVFELHAIGDSTSNFRPDDPYIQNGKVVAKPTPGTPHCSPRYFVQGDGTLPMKAHRTVLPPTGPFEVMSVQGSQFKYGHFVDLYTIRITARDGKSLDIRCWSHHRPFRDFAELQEQLEGVIELR